MAGWYCWAIFAPDRRSRAKRKVMPSMKRLRTGDYRETIARRFHTLLTPSDRDLLARFYLDGQTPEEICRELQISLAEFLARKARAKAILTSGIAPKCAANAGSVKRSDAARLSG